MADAISGSLPICKKLSGITGFCDFKNDMLVYGSIKTRAKQHVIYFGGDVQDDKEKMMIFNPEYVKWNLEDTAVLLQKQFPQSTVFVVKPVQMYLYTFSLFKNFLHFDVEGRPDFSSPSGCWHHLVGLYRNAREKWHELDTSETENLDSEVKTFDDVPIHIVGFSKGCVVLNQLMFELKHSMKSSDVQGLVKQIKSFNWLDGGHIGGKNAYITDDEVLKEMVNLNKDINVHVTPYQIKDTTRAWIGKEEEKFVDKVRKLNGKITEYRHFMNEKGSITNHFKVLTKL